MTSVSDKSMKAINYDGIADGYDERYRGAYRPGGVRVYQRSQTDNPGCPEEIRIRKRVV